MQHRPFDIRRLCPSDLSLVRQLNALFGDVFDDPDTYGAAPPEEAWLTGLLAKEHVVVLVALSGRKVLGGLVAYELDKFERARRELYIYDLAVTADHRRRASRPRLSNTFEPSPRSLRNALP
ncbi:hypothetical protein [Pseudaminobacter sp. NGMCC 1.201702]|uniref:hypothetical protein n=1 Tax=Pseudaminobacter sp. NGMCC 1.201702 TaxID=3391825 RepID=UPI0039F09DDA